MPTNESLQEQQAGGWVWLFPLASLLVVVAWPLLTPLLPAWLVAEQAAWILSRSSGVVAYLLLSLSTIWGLLLSTRLVQKRIAPAISLGVHNHLSWTSIGLTIFHALILLFDNWYHFTLATLIVPFAAPYSPLWVGIGLIGFYLMLLTSATFYLRKQIGQKNWRRLHYLTFLAYLATTLHGIQAGTDTATLGFMYGLSGFTVLTLTILRLIGASQKALANNARNAT